MLSFGDARVAAQLDGGEPAAPDLLIVETLNAFWKFARSGRSTPPRADILSVLDRIRMVPSRPFASRAAELAQRFDHAVYDCLYLALAEAEEDRLLTADKRLLSTITDRALRKRIRLLDVR